MTRGRRLVSNTGLFAVASASSQAISFLLVPLYTHLLTPAEFGLIDLVVITAGLMMPLVSLTMFEAVLRFVMDTSLPRAAVTTNSVVLAGVTSGVFVMTYPLVARSGFLDGALPYAYAIIVVQVFYAICSQYVKGIGRMRTYALGGVLQTLLLGLGNILTLVVFHLGVAGYLGSILASSLIASVYLVAASGMLQDVRWSATDAHILRRMLTFSLPLVPNSAMWWFVNSSNRYFLVFFSGVGSVGVYAIAGKVPLMLYVFTTVFSQAWQVSAFESYTADDRDQFYSRVFKYFSAVMLLGCSGLLVVLKPAFRILFAAQYYDGWRLVPFLLLASAFSSFAAFLGTSYTAARATAGTLYTSLVAALVAIALNVGLIPFFGALGAAVAAMLSFGVLWGMRVVHTRRYIKVDTPVRTLLPAFAAVAAQTTVIHLGLPPWEEVALNALILAALAWVLRHVVRDVVRMVARPAGAQARAPRRNPSGH